MTDTSATSPSLVPHLDDDRQGRYGLEKCDELPGERVINLIFEEVGNPRALTTHRIVATFKNAYPFINSASVIFQK